MADEQRNGGNGAAERLLTEFSQTTYSEWRQVAEQSLKGAPFEKRLITPTYEGIDLQPMYWADDIAGLEQVTAMPGFAPFLRGVSASGTFACPRGVAQRQRQADPAAWNTAVRHDTERGQTVVEVALDRPTTMGQDADQAPAHAGQGGLSLITLADLEQALAGIDPLRTPVAFTTATPLPLLAIFRAYLQRHNIDTSQLYGAVMADPLGILAATGNLPLPLADIYADMAEAGRWAIEHTGGTFTVAVDGEPYHEAGASAVEELAFAIATGTAYLRALTEQGLSVDEIAPRFRFSFSLGSQVFMEIARLRAARLLWSQVVAAFGGNASARRMNIHARTGQWNKTRHDPYVNMLRTTTEAFAAVVGGCESLDVAGFDDIFGPSDEFARRIARNSQFVLRDEAHLDKTIDASGGSWYIEKLTDQVARAAWELFQEIERRGGMAEALTSGFVQEHIGATTARRDKALAQRRDVLVGTNMYADPKERPLERVPSLSGEARLAIAQQARAAERSSVALALTGINSVEPGKRLPAAITAAETGATIGEISGALRSSGEAPVATPLRIYRGAEPYEALRAAAAKYAAQHGKPPQAFLANMGPVSQHKARADFASGFLQVAGFEMITNYGFASPAEAAAAAAESGAPVVVICSTDDTYPELVPALAGALKSAGSNAVLALAGYPSEHVEALRAAGVEEFIHLRADALETLGRLLARIS